MGYGHEHQYQDFLFFDLYTRQAKLTPITTISRA